MATTPNNTFDATAKPNFIDTYENWKEAGDWLKYTVGSLSIVNFATLILVMVSYVAVCNVRRRSRELDLFLNCMERQIQRSVLPVALTQKAIEAANAGSIREAQTGSVILSKKAATSESAKKAESASKLSVRTSVQVSEMKSKK